MRRSYVLSVALLIAACCLATSAPALPRPNILIILADDLGYSDLGCYGGEIETPNLDRLAEGGLRFLQFYNTARCWPTRGALLTGYYAQQIRRDVITGDPQIAVGHRPAWARLLPEMLKSASYRSYHSGKWHVDGGPVAGGFDHSYWVEDQDRHFSPKKLYDDDEPLPAVKRDSGFYSTVAIADHAIAQPERTCRRSIRAAILRIPRVHRAAFSDSSVAGGHRALSNSVQNRMGSHQKSALGQIATTRRRCQVIVGCRVQHRPAKRSNARARQSRPRRNQSATPVGSS